jgi:hypothetical protein
MPYVIINIRQKTDEPDNHGYHSPIVLQLTKRCYIDTPLFASLDKAEAALDELNKKYPELRAVFAITKYAP